MVLRCEGLRSENRAAVEERARPSEALRERERLLGVSREKGPHETWCGSPGTGEREADGTEF